MSQSNQGAGALGLAALFCSLAIAGSGLFAYQYLRTTQLALEEQRVALAARETAERMTAQAAAEQLAAEHARVRLETLNAAPDSAATNFSLAESEIQSKLTAQQADWNKGDLDAFMKVYWPSEQLTFASGGKVTRGWQATLDSYKSRYSTKEKRGTLTFGDLEYQPLGPTVTLVLGTWHLERSEDSVGGNFSLIWRKIDGQWLIVHDHTSALQPAK